jgi:hypothetical protein
MKRLLETTVLVGLLGLGAVVAATGPASAAYTITRCDGDSCRVVHCDEDGDFCRTVSHYDRDLYRRHYYTSSSYWRDRDYDNHRYWVCDADGDNCRWSYDY